MVQIRRSCKVVARPHEVTLLVWHSLGHSEALRSLSDPTLEATPGPWGARQLGKQPWGQLCAGGQHVPTSKGKEPGLLPARHPVFQGD